MTIYLNADIGEGSLYDGELLDFVSYVNIACGGHAGSSESIFEAISLSLDKSVKVGAHPSYPDVSNFGRVSMREVLSVAEISESVCVQVENFLNVFSFFPKGTIHIKAHGALYNDSSKFENIASAFLAGVNEAVAKFGLSRREVTLFVQPDTFIYKLALASGYLVMKEGFIDRRYKADGSLTSRTEVGSVLEEESDVVRQILGFSKYGDIVTDLGESLPISVDTLCIHSDTSNCVSSAKLAKQILDGAYGV